MTQSTITEDELYKDIDNYLKYSNLYEENMTNSKRKKLLLKSIEYYQIDIDYLEYLMEKTFDNDTIKGYQFRIEMDKYLIREIRKYIAMLPKQKRKKLKFRGIYERV